MTGLDKVEHAWCDWQETLGAREREVYRQSLVPFKAGAAYERARIRRELLEAIGEADARSRRSLSDFHGSLSAEALRVLRENIETVVDKIVQGEG